MDRNGKNAMYYEIYIAHLLNELIVYIFASRF